MIAFSDNALHLLPKGSQIGVVLILFGTLSIRKKAFLHPQELLAYILLELSKIQPFAMENFQLTLCLLELFLDICQVCLDRCLRKVL